MVPLNETSLLILFLYACHVKCDIFTGVEVDLGANWLNSMVVKNPLAKIVANGDLEVKSAGNVQLHFPKRGQVFTGEDANKIFTEFYQVCVNLTFLILSN
jgi:hypothetical protein